MNSPRFRGQSAIVTGGADGIGKSVARQLASEDAIVTMVDVSERGLEDARSEFVAAGLDVAAELTDISSEDDVRSMIDRVVQRTKRLDIVVNCAGVVGPTATKITEVDVQDFDRVGAINLRGSFLIVKHSLPPMLTNDYGRILLFASIAGKEGNAGMCCYSASKAGVIGLTKAVGKEFAETNVTINAIAPAVVRTAMVDSIRPEQVKYMTDKIPMKRCGTLQEVSSLACWIVSQEASFSTGFTFDLSGGRATY